MTGSKVAPSADESWDLPHEDAAGYAESVIGSLVSYSLNEEGQIQDPWTEEFGLDFPDIEEMRAKSAIARGRSVKADRADAESEWEYHKEAFPDDSTALLRDLEEVARTALAAREADDLLDALEALIDQSGLHTPGSVYAALGLENWVDLLDRPIISDSGEEERAADAETKAAIVEAIRSLSERLCELIAENPHALDKIEWRHLEYVVAAALDEIGFKVELTPPAKDGGKDVIAACTVRGRALVFYIEIKHWRSGKRVGSKDIFTFVEINMQDRTDGGLFLSSSGFSNDVYSHLVEIKRKQLRLGAREKIVLLCQRFHRKRRGLWTPVDQLPKVLFEETM